MPLERGRQQCLEPLGDQGGEFEVYERGYDDEGGGGAIFHTAILH